MKNRKQPDTHFGMKRPNSSYRNKTKQWSDVHGFSSAEQIDALPPP